MIDPQRTEDTVEASGDAATLTDEEIETRRFDTTAGARASDDSGDDSGDTSDTGDDSGDTSDTSDTGDDSGDSGDDSGSDA